MAILFKQILGRYRCSSMLVKLLSINCAVFLLLRVAGVVCMLSGHADWQSDLLIPFQLPASAAELLHYPWTAVTYMFTQINVMHILFNMLWFYWFGMMFMDTNTQRQLLALYVYGGLAGAAMFVGISPLLPGLHEGSSGLIGSSAAVLAIVTATAIMQPDRKVELMFIGEVKVKWIAVATLVIDLLSMSNGNAGGHISHIGGIAAGTLYAMAMARGTDITRPFSRAIAAIGDAVRGTLNRSRKPDRAPAPVASATDRETLDAILDKIKKSNYSSLTPQERKTLFEISSRIK